MADKTVVERAFEWLLYSRDTGRSSEAICAYMVGGVGNTSSAHPLDAADLGRCLRLLNQFPEWKARMWEMGDLTEEWSELVRHWDELATLYRQEKYDECSRRMDDLLTPIWKRRNEIARNIREYRKANADPGHEAR
jgi:hypothetical protein